ncbi:MAG TPA: 2Fe-2S iron-sulfur cluster-binding protein [Ktedonobacterales bacterium]|nr:2Fe-2S iron-sulfur cluster-binding protein [Ktedonobacterales bacterium]
MQPGEADDIEKEFPMATAISDTRRAQATTHTITVQVTATTPAARNAVTFTLALPGTHGSPGPYRAGQFITLTIPTASGAPLYRSYSLCGDGNADAPWQITVKRTAGGRVSNYLIDRIRPGMALQCSQPQGSFTMTQRPHPGVPFVFVAGGSGITPVYAMLRALARMAPEERPRVTLHYAYHGPEDAIFGRELAALDPQRTWLTQRHYMTTQGQRLSPARIVAAMAAEAAQAQWYVCGPAALRHDLEATASNRGIPTTHLHAEIFASPSARRANRPAHVGKAARIRLADSGAVLVTRPGETLLETLERGGYRPDFSCRAGACATCRLKVLSGRVCASGENNALTPDERARGYVLSCVAEPEGDLTLATAGRRVAAPWAGSTGGARRPTTAARLAARRGLRAGVAAATIGLFAGMWGLTHTSSATASAVNSSGSSSNGSSSSSSSSGSDDSSNSSSATDNGSSSSSNSGNSGSIFTAPSLGGSNSSTGTS